MAVATPTTLTKNGSALSAALYTTALVTFTAGRFYLLTYASRTGITVNPTQPTATGTGMTFTIVPTNGTVVYDDTSSSRKRVTVFYGLCSSNTTTTVVFDEGGQTQTNAEWAIDEIASGLVTTGTNGIDAIVQSINNFDDTATAATITATLGSNLATTANATYASFAEGNGGTFSAGTGYTAISESHVSTAVSILTQFRQTASLVTDKTASATDNMNSELGVIMLELNASASASTPRMLASLGVGN